MNEYQLSNQQEIRQNYQIVPSPAKSNQQNYCNPAYQRLKQLEGQCKILEYQLLQINYCKMIFAVIIMTITVIGLLLLKYYKELRCILFYNKLSLAEIERATHVYAKGTDQTDQICEIITLVYEEKKRIIFEFNYLKYQLMSTSFLPLGFNDLENLQLYRNDHFIASGLSQVEATKRQYLYGKNQHKVKIPNYFEYLFDIMTKPFFIFQYIVCFIYFMQNVVLFSIVMLFFSFLTTSINYILLYRSYTKIKETAEKIFPINVLREKAFIEIKSNELVPGDLYLPTEEVPCDSIIMKGSLFVDEASLTGQNVPIQKTFIKQEKDLDNHNHWIYEGSKIQTCKDQTIAMVVNIGFASNKGRIIRKIIARVIKQPQFFTKLMYFLVEITIIFLVLYFATFQQLNSMNIDKILVFFRFLDFLTYGFPPVLPIFFNLAYAFCLVRLKRDGILGTQSQKTVQGARVKTIYFDKTGTLTLSQMNLSKIYSIHHEKEPIKQINGQLNNHQLIKNIFGCCNSVELINGRVKGDQIDLKLFEHVQAQLQPSLMKQVVRQIKIGEQILQILRINQYSSVFQSMSVMYRQKLSKRCFIAVKGNPQLIDKCSQLKNIHFKEFLKKKSLDGYRTIAFGSKQITQRQIQSYMKAQRQNFLSKIIIHGLVTFVNKIKDDAKQTISTLTNCQISTKIITGDNIYLGVKTALEVGMIENNKRIIIVEGHKYDRQSNTLKAVQLKQNDSGQITQKENMFCDFNFQNNESIVYAIDNNFIKLKQDFMHQKIKVFARITPENKGLIVRKHKQLIDMQMKSLNNFRKVFGQCSLKIVMIGDGANDLIAIKQADIGIAISQSDAVFSATFAITQLKQILNILCQGKNVQAQIINMVYVIIIVNIIAAVSTIYLSTDYSYNTSNQLIYRVFANYVVHTLALGVSRPSKTLTKYLPSSNFMGKQNHIVIWVNGIIISVGLAASYYYYTGTNDFIPNPTTHVAFGTGWESVNQSATVMFLSSNILITISVFCVFRSSPWKQKFYQNLTLTIIFVLNMVLITLIHFYTDKLSFLDIVPILNRHAGIIFAINCGTCLLCLLANTIIEKCQFHKELSTIPNDNYQQLRTKSISHQ